MAYVGCPRIGDFDPGSFFLASLKTALQTERFVGTLQPNQTPKKLQLPAGVPLKALLVKPGELVRAGQTVAVLDEAAMRAQLSHINRSIVVANVLRACLLRSDETRNVATVSCDENKAVIPIHTNGDQELDLLVRAAKADSVAGQREDLTKFLRLERALNVLQARLALLNQKLAMVLGVHVKNEKMTCIPFCAHMPV